MKNNNGASIRKLSNRSLKNNRMRNLFAMLAIILTGILFTAVFSLTSGAMQAAQENTMREVGGKFHVGIKAVTMEQYKKVTADPMIKRSDYTILIGRADNILKRQAELRYMPKETALQQLKDMFITLEEGHIPEEENEIIVDTFILDELHLPYALGEKIPFRFSFMGETVEDEFVVSGWYRGDPIGHASEVFFSESYWTKLKGTLTDEDFMNRKEAHPEDSGAGLINGNLFFNNERNLEEKIRTVIQNAGYEPGTELAYGVNWAYMSSRVEAVDPFTFILLSGAVVVILITGYLIIYNIFQISVISDIRFYGLLKTIGTTKKQMRWLVRRQAVMLSMVGIPVGLAIGYGISKLALPFALSINNYDGMEISLRFNPWVLVLGAGFSALTVFLSSRKPGKIAGSISPIEAVRYTEAGSSQRKGRRKQSSGKMRGRREGCGFSAVSMAIANIGRNRRTAAVVITAISFSMILLAIVMTAVGSFRLDQFLEQRIVGDYVIGHSNVTSGSVRSMEVTIEPEFLALADGQEGIEKKQKMWIRYGTFLQMDDKAVERFRELDAAGRLRRNVHSEQTLDKILRGEKSLQGNFYGYDEELLSNLHVLDGTFELEKFRTGDYILLTQIFGSEHLPAEEHGYHPGDTVTVEMVTEDTMSHEIKGETGETIDFEYDNLAEKKYEVMAIVEIPSGMSLNTHFVNACDAVLPLSAFTLQEDGMGADAWTYCFAVSYQVREEEQAAFEAAIKEYTEQNTQMGYASKNSLAEEFEGMITVVAAIGISLAVVVALIGILNFINAVITQIISRKREFAMLQSIGMTNAQLQKTLVCEGVGYIVISGAISFIAGSLLSWLILRALNHVILFFEYQFQIMPFVIMIPVLMLVAVLAPVLAYKNLRKKSIVERLRESE